LKVPCKQCLAYPRCKMRERTRPKFFMDDGKWPQSSVYNIADNEKCHRLKNFLDNADQDHVNAVRVLFDMEPYR